MAPRFFHSDRVSIRAKANGVPYSREVARFALFGGRLPKVRVLTPNVPRSLICRYKPSFLLQKCRCNRYIRKLRAWKCRCMRGRTQNSTRNRYNRIPMWTLVHFLQNMPMHDDPKCRCMLLHILYSCRRWSILTANGHFNRPLSANLISRW